MAGLLDAAVAVPVDDDCCEPQPKFNPDAKLAMSANGSLFVDTVELGGGFECVDDGEVSVLVGRKSSALPIKLDSLPNGSKVVADAVFFALKFKPSVLKSGKLDEFGAVLLLFVGANAPNKSSNPCDDLTFDSDNRSGIAEGAGAVVSVVSNDPSKSKLASFAGIFKLPLLLLMLLLLLRGSIFRRSTSGCAISGIASVSFAVRSSECDDTGIGGFAGLAGGMFGFGGGIEVRGCDGLGGGGRSCDFDVGFVTKTNKSTISQLDKKRPAQHY